MTLMDSGKKRLNTANEKTERASKRGLKYIKMQISLSPTDSLTT